MAAKDTQFTAKLDIDLVPGQETGEEIRNDFKITATVTEIGEARERNGATMWWNDVPPPMGGIDPIKYIVNLFYQRLKRYLPKDAVLDGSAGTIEVTTDYRTANRMQARFLQAANSTNRLGRYMERQLPKKKKDRRTKRGRGERN